MAPRRLRRALPPGGRTRGCDAWETSRIPLFRTAYQALHRIILGTWYADPASHPGIGYAGPLHARAPRVPWEGPLPGSSTDAEPVARTEGARTARVISIRPQLDLLSGDPTLSSIIEGARLRGDTRVRADVCVIGSGAGGAVAAARLAEAGHDVVLLEEGAFWRPEQFTEREAEMMPRLYADAAARATDDLSIPMLQGRAVGGGTTVNWLVMLRTPDWVLDEWAPSTARWGCARRTWRRSSTRIEEETHTRAVPDDAHSPANRRCWMARERWGGARGGCNQRARLRALRFLRAGVPLRRPPRGRGRVPARAPWPRGARLFTDVRAERIELAERGGGSPLKRVHATLLDRDTRRAARPRRRSTRRSWCWPAARWARRRCCSARGWAGGGSAASCACTRRRAVFGALRSRDVRRRRHPALRRLRRVPARPRRLRLLDRVAALLPGAASRRSFPGFGGAPGDDGGGAAPGAMIVLVRDGADRARSNGERDAWTGAAPRLLATGWRRTGARRLRGMDAAARMHFAAGRAEVSTLHTHACGCAPRPETGRRCRSRALRPHRLGDPSPRT